jgi:diguanylate cyclase (GGDEF)-like protein
MTTTAFNEEKLMNKLRWKIVPYLFLLFMIAMLDRMNIPKQRHQLELISRTDSVTGLCNRRHIELRIHEEYEQYQRTGSEFVVIIADIDLFKVIHDTYGHVCGDFILKSVSKDLEKLVREYNTVARWGGDEFLLLLPTTIGEDALGLAKRISKTLEKRRYAYGLLGL